MVVFGVPARPARVLRRHRATSPGRSRCPWSAPGLRASVESVVEREEGVTLGGRCLEDLNEKPSESGTSLSGDRRFGQEGQLVLVSMPWSIASEPIGEEPSSPRSPSAASSAACCRTA